MVTFLGTLYKTKDDALKGENSINAEMVSLGFAYEYGGGRKRQFGDWCPE